MKERRRTSSRGFTLGFTLVELLVVIGIIALLVSILLPSLARARKAAQTIACAANLRSIMQAVQIFASQNNGQIPGSHTSGKFLFIDPMKGNGATNIANSPYGKYSDSVCPSVVTFADWASPVAKLMNVKFEEGWSTTDRAKRWARIRDLPQFQCPSNDIVATLFASGGMVDDAPNHVIVSNGRMFSYCAAQGFLLRNNASGATPNDLVGISITRPDWNVPASYSPKITKVGDAARKVFLADGAKFSNATTAPDTDLSFTGQFGGPFADQGPTKFGRAWARDRIPTNGGTGLETRAFWARHGANVKIGGPSGSYRFNVAFFDGHVETLDDLTGADPKLWWPKGTSLNITSSQLYQDVINRYFPGATSPQTLP